MDDNFFFFFLKGGDNLKGSNWRSRWEKGVSDFFWPIFVFLGLKWTQLDPVTMTEWVLVQDHYSKGERLV